MRFASVDFTRWLGLILSLLFATGCMRTEMVPVLYRVPISDNSRGAAAAENCVAACRTASEGSDAAFFACVGTCPDVQVKRGVECGPATEPRDNPPRAFCFTRFIEELVPDPETAQALLELFGELAKVGSRLSSNHSYGGHRSSGGAHRHHEHGI